MYLKKLVYKNWESHYIFIDDSLYTPYFIFLLDNNTKS